MRPVLILAPLLLLAGCNRAPPSILNGAEPEPPVQDNMLSGMNFALSDPGFIAAAEMQPRSIAALRALIQDSERARYEGLRLGRLGSICGTVRPAEGNAPARPFLVEPDGRGAIAAGPRVDLTRTTDRFVERYVRYCATAEDVGVDVNQAVPAAPPPMVETDLPPTPAAPRPPMQPERWTGPATERVAPEPLNAPNSFRDAVRPPR